MKHLHCLSFTETKKLTLAVIVIFKSFAVIVEWVKSGLVAKFGQAA